MLFVSYKLISMESILIIVILYMLITVFLTVLLDRGLILVDRPLIFLFKFVKFF